MLIYTRTFTSGSVKTPESVLLVGLCWVLSPMINWSGTWCILDIQNFLIVKILTLYVQLLYIWLITLEYLLGGQWRSSWEKEKITQDCNLRGNQQPIQLKRKTWTSHKYIHAVVPFIIWDQNDPFQITFTQPYEHLIYISCRKSWSLLHFAANHQRIFWTIYNLYALRSMILYWWALLSLFSRIIWLLLKLCNPLDSTLHWSTFLTGTNYDVLVLIL